VIKVVHARDVGNVVVRESAAVTSGEESLKLVLFRGRKLFGEVLDLGDGIVHGDSGIAGVVDILVVHVVKLFELRVLSFNREGSAVEEAVGVVLDGLVVFNGFKLVIGVFRLDIGVLEETAYTVGMVIHELGTAVIKSALVLVEIVVVDTFKFHFSVRISVLI
jgi:hypothetical protein